METPTSRNPRPTLKKRGLNDKVGMFSSHPSNNPDLAFSDYLQRGSLERYILCVILCSDDAIIAKIKWWGRSLDETFFGESIYALITDRTNAPISMMTT